MSIEHVSRTGKKYYLYVVEGKSGKPRFHFSTRAGGALAEAVPAGFEVYENIGGQVFLRRKVRPLITEDEVDRVRAALRRKAEEWVYRVEVKKNVLTIYETNGSEDRIEAYNGFAPSWMSKKRLKESIIRNASYMGVLRFVLTDREKRLFRPERYCFRGSVDDWIEIGEPEKLPVVIRKFIPHLGNESMFELF